MMVLPHLVTSFSVALILAPFSYFMGLGARHLRLPQITGYLISGIICGPYILGILSTEFVLDLNVIEGACLSIIGLAAGAELDWPSLSRSRKQVIVAGQMHAAATNCDHRHALLLACMHTSPPPTQVLGITTAICLGTWVFCYIAFDWMNAAFPLMPDMDAAHLTAVATLGATLMMTRSPASAVSLRGFSMLCAMAAPRTQPSLVV